MRYEVNYSSFHSFLNNNDNNNNNNNYKNNFIFRMLLLSFIYTHIQVNLI